MTVSRVALAVAGLITALLLQATLIGPLTFPVPVSLPVVLVIVAAVYGGPGIGMGLGFTTGLVADLGSDHPAGVQALCWLAAGLAGGIVGGLATQRGYGCRGVAALTAVIGALSSVVVGVLLAILGSHAATATLAFRDVIPVGLTEALVALVAAPVVRKLLLAQGIRSPRPVAHLIGRPNVLR